MNHDEWLASFRPFELFCDCLTFEVDLDSLMQRYDLSSEEWEGSYISSQEVYAMYFAEIERRNLKEAYLDFKNYCGEKMLYGTE